MSAVLYWERTNVHLLHLKQDNVIIPLPYTHEGWEEVPEGVVSNNVSISILSYFVHFVASEQQLCHKSCFM